MADEMPEMAEEMPEWFEAVDIIRAKVQLTETDSVTLLALPQSDLLKQLPKFVKLAAKLESADEMTDEEVNELIESQDGILTPMIEAWVMTDHAKAYGREFPVPSTLDPADRVALYGALPFPAVKRLMRAVALHLGNE